MKTKIAILSVLFFAFVNYAFVKKNENQSKLDWLTFDEMKEAQLVEKRKVLIDVYADWCFWCKKMDENSLSQKQIADCISENYYLVKFNPEDEEEISFNGKKYFQKEYNYSNSNKTREVNALAIEWMGIDFVYPTLIILDEELNKLSVFDGYKTAKDLDPILNYFSTDSHLKVKWSTYSKSFQSTIKD